MARQAGNLPTAEVAENTFRQRFAFFLQAGDLVGNVQRIVIAHQTKTLDLGLQVGNGLFEIKKIRVHDRSV